MFLKLGSYDNGDRWGVSSGLGDVDDKGFSTGEVWVSPTSCKASSFRDFLFSCHQFSLHFLLFASDARNCRIPSVFMFAAYLTRI